MGYLWYAAGGLVGLALGLHFGRLLFVILTQWESTATAGKWYISIIGFVLGGGAGAIIFRWFCVQYADAFYAIGLGLGLIIAYIRPRMPFLFALADVVRIVKMSEGLRDKLPVIEQRLLLILSLFRPPKWVEHELKMEQQQLAKRLEEATDAFDDRGGKSRDNQSGENDGDVT